MENSGMDGLQEWKGTSTSNLRIGFEVEDGSSSSPDFTVKED